MMAKKKREAAGGMNNIKRRVVILIAVAAMAVCSLVVVRGVLLANAQRMGNEIAHSYSAENTRNLIGYETMLRLCIGYIDQQLKSSRSQKNGNGWQQYQLRLCLQHGAALANHTAPLCHCFF